MKKKGQIEIKKVDKEDVKYPIQDVVFEVKNMDGKVVQTIITDENGIAITKELPVGEYKIQEIQTKEEYVLKEDIIKIEIKEDEITKLQVENEKIKGRIRIIKTSEDDNLINGIKAGEPIPNVKFEIYDIQGKLKDTMITNEEGIAESQLLEKGIYRIKEVETGKEYILKEDIIETEIEEHNQLIELEIQNKSVTVNKLPRTGF